jgi:hypothetical protein
MPDNRLVPVPGSKRDGVASHNIIAIGGEARPHKHAGLVQPTHELALVE